MVRSFGRRRLALLALLLLAGVSGCQLDDLLAPPAAPPLHANLALSLALVAPTGKESGAVQQQAPEGVRIRVLVRADGEGSGQNIRLDTLVVAPPQATEVELLLPIPLQAGAAALATQLGIEVWQSTRSVLRGETSATLRPDQTTALEVALAPPGGGRLRGIGLISAGFFHACATVPETGLAYCWGKDDDGQLGTLTTGAPLPQEVLSDVPLTSLTAGLTHTCGVELEGQVLCWGSGRFGSIGAGVDIPATPVPVPAYFLDQVVYAVSAGGSQNCALTVQEQTYCWGLNDRGQLGVGTRVDSNIPLVLDHSFSAVGAGYGHTCGLIYYGVVCWGDNTWGQLGDGTTTMKLTPVYVDSSYIFVSVSAGGGHTCALDEAGQAYCWGYNRWGQLGAGSSGNASRPAQVGGGHRFRSISAGGSHTCALDDGGRAYCWGNNDHGALGDGTTIERRTPVPVSGGESFGSIVAGFHFTCGVTLEGEGLCWGSNAHGQLGNGSRLDTPRPMPVLTGEGATFASWAQSEAATADTLLTIAGHGLAARPHPAEVRVTPDLIELVAGDTARLTASLLDQFGDPIEGAGLDALEWESANPAIATVDDDGLVTGRGPGEAQVYARRAYFMGSATVRVAAPAASHLIPIGGDNQEATVGIRLAQEPVVRVLDIDGRGVAGAVVEFAITAGGGTIAPSSATTDGDGYARTVWTLGPAAGENTLQARVAGVTSSVVFRALGLAPLAGPVVPALVTGQSHTCGLTDQGRSYCWGNNSSGQLGDGTTNNMSSPGDGRNGLRFVQLAAGSAHTCGLTATRTAYCWGNNNNGQLGSVTAGSVGLSPAAVEGWHAFTALAAGGNHTCGIDTTGAAYCWGDNRSGQLGVEGGAGSRITPVPVGGGHHFTSLIAGGSHTCGLTVSGSVYCWGYNAYGQLGIGSADATPHGSPLRVAAPTTPFLVLAAGESHTCGVTTEHTIYCWGLNSHGQLGNGSGSGFQAVPTRISGVDGMEFPFLTVAAGGWHTCALDLEYTAFCWGRDDSGQLGTGSVRLQLNEPLFVHVNGVSNHVSITIGELYTCSLSVDWEAYCWGSNLIGQFGDGVTTSEPTPYPAPAAIGVRFRSD
jgi:alpha-tubulin suppressor-like RCC1 family protein